MDLNNMEFWLIVANDEGIAQEEILVFSYEEATKLEQLLAKIYGRKSVHLSNLKVGLLPENIKDAIAASESGSVVDDRFSTYSWALNKPEEKA